MKKLVATGMLVVLSACGVPAKTIVTDIITGEQAACVILNATVSVPEIEAVCGISSQLAPVIQQIVNSLATRDANLKKK